MKHYRVIKENFLWDLGAILELNEDDMYAPITEAYYLNEFAEGEVISHQIIENCPAFFQRVYQDSKDHNLFYTKEESKNIFGKIEIKL